MDLSTETVYFGVFSICPFVLLLSLFVPLWGTVNAEIRVPSAVALR